MDAATRRLLQKRKQSMHNSIKANVSIDEVEIREATKEKLREVLDVDEAKPDQKDTDAKQPLQLAKSIEETLHKTYKAHSPEYKTAFRKLYVSLKNKNLPFKADLLSGKLDPIEFALKPAEKLKSTERLTKDEEIKEKEMRMSVGVQLLPENVNKVKDGRDREKWGVSRSAAAVDD